MKCACSDTWCAIKKGTPVHERQCPAYHYCSPWVGELCGDCDYCLTMQLAYYDVADRWEDDMNAFRLYREAVIANA